MSFRKSVKRFQANNFKFSSITLLQSCTLLNELRIDVADGANGEARFKSPAPGGKNHRSSELNRRSLPAWTVLGMVLCCLQFKLHRQEQTRFLACLAKLIV